MTTPKPDEHAVPADPGVAAAWRAASNDAPPATLDAAIRAAARREVGAGPHGARAQEATRARQNWWPLAAAAAVAAIAVGLLQLTTPDQLGTLPSGKTSVTDMPSPDTSPAPGQAASASREERAKDAAAPERTAPRTTVPPAPSPAAVAPAPTTSSAQPSLSAAAPEPFPAGSATDRVDGTIAGKPAPAIAGGRAAPEPRQAPLPPAVAGSGAVGEPESGGAAVIPGKSAAGARPPGAPEPTAAASPATTESLQAGSESVGARRAAVAGITAGNIADSRQDEALAKERAALPVADWIALIRRLRTEGKTTDAARELAAFRVAHADHERLLPPDLRDWRPAAK